MYNFIYIETTITWLPFHIFKTFSLSWLDELDKEDTQGPIVMLI